MKRFLFFSLGAALLLAGMAFSQDKKDQKPEFDLAAYAKFAEPGPHHKQLEPLAGNWTVKVKFYLDPSKPPMESTGTCDRKWIMGGRFLEEHFQGDDKANPFSGMGLVGYDNGQKKFTYAWVDTMSSGIATSTGTGDASGKVFTYTGENFCPVMGKPVKTRDVVTITSNDQHQMEMYRMMSDGKEARVMELHFTRVKK